MVINLLPNKIQERENINLLGSKSQLPVIIDDNKQLLDSDGNRVNVGNFDSNGLNVNNYRDDNRNDNIGVSSSRNFFLYKIKTPSFVRECFNLEVFCRFNPPTKHSPNFINHFLQQKIFFIINSFYLLAKTDKHS